MPSKALQSLTTRLNDIAELLKAHRKVSGDKVGRKYEVAALNRAGLVLLSAHLEGFIENLVEECVSLMHANGVAVANVPARLRAAQLEATVMKPVPQNDHVTANKRVQEMAPTLANLWAPVTVVTNSLLKASPILSQMSNPGTKEIDHVFWYFDIDKAMDHIWWNRAGNDAVKRNINELVGKRNAIAHGNQNVNVWKSDVERYQKYVTGVAKALDKKMETKLHAILNQAPW